MAYKQLDLVTNQSKFIPQTEGIKYAGSKLKIIPFIIQLISELHHIKTVLDGFTGTTRVAQTFAQLGYNTTANDIAVWSEVFANCYLKSSKPDNYYQEIIDELNNLKGYDGWFTEKYGGTISDSKKPFQIHNTRKLDAIRDKIEELNLDNIDKSVILTSLIYALDEVDSTLGHYVSYLSKWSPRSFNTMEIKLPKRFKLTSTNTVIRDNIFNTIQNNTFDLAYFDPPYGSNNEKMPSSRVRYNSYYHIWTTVILNDKPKLFGKVNRREDTKDTVNPSVFEEYKKDTDGHFIAMKALGELIKQTKAHYLLLSYSSGGRATKQELLDIIASNGKLIRMTEIDYKKNVMANMKWTNEWINSNEKYKEYLFLMEK
jgi:adenine-specific DNA-methyltransferase